MIEAPSPPRAGERVAGRYVCSKLLGSGGMGQVLLAEDELEHGRRVALKLLRHDAFRPEWVDLLKAEFGALARLRHPGLVEVFEFGVDPASGLPYLTLEPLKGTSILRAPLARDAHGLVDISIQALKALAFIHAEGYLHYDLKPSNVFVTDQGQVKLMDFALTGSPGRSALHKGTPAYAAPEMIRLEPVDRRLDLYSLGATLYHVLAGRPPFGGSLTDVLRGQLYRAPPPLALTDERRFLERFVFRLLAKRPEDRYFSAEQALTELAHLSRHHVVLPPMEDSYLLTAKIIGRERELEQLKRPLDALEAPELPEARPLLLLVSGDSGLGKSRLMRELEVEAQLRSLSISSGHCAPRGLLPLQALREAVRQPALDASRRFPELVSEAREELGHLLPGLRGDLGATGAAQPHEDGRAVAERLGRFLLAYSARQSLVLHLGDLQWADESTVQVIELVVRALQRDPRSARLVVYASYRPTESADQPWGRAVQRLAGSPGVHVLALDPLGPAAVTQMLGSMLGTSNLDELLAHRVANLTGGNPLFVEETLRYLIDWGLLVRHGGRLELMASMEEMPLPQSVTQALSMAFEGLGQDEIDLVQALAVIGRPAPAGLLGDVLAVSGEEVRSRARALIPKHFISRNWTETDYLYALRHDQFSNYLYERLSPVAKSRLHASVAVVLERELGLEPDPSQVLELAVHFSEGVAARPADEAYRERALRWCVQAGNLAAHLVSYQKAAELLGRAQRVAMRGGGAYRQQLLDVTIALVLVLDTLSDEARKQRELQRLERLVQMMQQPVASVE
jgi:hypothetical protein